MTPITEPIEMLDKVQEWFAMGKKEMLSISPVIPSENVSYEEASKSVIEFFPGMDNVEFLLHRKMIFKKLINDGYISEENNLYSITFEGKLFSKNGGYKKQIRNQSNQASLQFWQTWAIVIGTAAAGAYGLLEIGKWAFPLFRSCVK